VIDDKHGSFLRCFLVVQVGGFLLFDQPLKKKPRAMPGAFGFEVLGQLFSFAPEHVVIRLQL
jgi:hypothetical protein